MAELLDDQEIDDALAALQGWERDGDALVKSVQIPPDSQSSFEEAVAEVADELDHHPQVDHAGEAVTMRLWTHSAGGVTAKDVELAARIDTLLEGARRWHRAGDV